MSWGAVLLAVSTLVAQPNAGSIDVPAGERVMLQVKGEGFQIYTCTSTPPGQKWTLKAPDARLIDASGRVVGRHFAGPTWELADGSEVQGELIASVPSPDPGSAAWLLLRAKPGSGSGGLATTQFIRRTETHGGAAGSSGCESNADVGKTERIPYTATYTFYAPE